MHSAFDLGFRTTEKELNCDQLPVQGRIPTWLQGTLVRNGPGTFEIGQQSYRHWFDGLAMLHRFSFAEGNVSYANKFLNTKAYREAMETGRISYSEFATDPCRSLFSRISSVFSPQITDSAKVSVTRVADRFMALAETPIQVEFDPQTLQAVGVFNYEERLTGQMTTVHPQFDSARDEMYNVVTRYHRLSHYNVYKMVGGGQPQQVASLPVKKPAYMHSFGMTDRAIILTEFPLVVNPLSLLLWLKPYIENFNWEPQRGTPFWVINRHNGQLVGRFESEPFFAFHHVNAFEENDQLVVDLVAYDDAEIITTYYLNRLQDETLEVPFGQLRRYRIPLNGGAVSYETLSQSCMELPHFDAARFNRRPDYRYVYAISINPQQRQGFYNQLIKFDIKSATEKTWYTAGCYPGEPVFVANPEGTAEDDGVILSVVLDTNQGNSFLLVLDAATFSEIARATIPQPVLFGYHGAFFGGI